MLLVAAQLPQAVHLPIWVALFGFALVVLRFVLLRRDRARPLATPARIPSWALAVFALAIAFAIRKSYGYFVGRDPCVAFLFVLVGIKFLEVRTLRDGTLLVCLAIFLLITPFFYSQSMLAALAALPAVLAAGAALESLALRRSRSTHRRRGAPRGGAPRAMIAQGLPIAAALFVLFPRLASPLWGLPADHAASDRTVRTDGTRFDQRTGVERRRRVSRRLRRRAAAAARALLARPGARRSSTVANGARCRRTPGGRFAARRSARASATR